MSFKGLGRLFAGLSVLLLVGLAWSGGQSGVGPEITSCPNEICEGAEIKGTATPEGVTIEATWAGGSLPVTTKNQNGTTQFTVDTTSVTEGNTITITATNAAGTDDHDVDVTDCK